jgi:hypothetical protein
MGIVNRRNAMVGWAVWKLGKRLVRRKAKAAVSSAAPGTTRGKPALLGALAAVAALGGALVFWRRRSSDDDVPQ